MHTEPIFKKLEILPLHLQIKFNNLVFIHSSIYKTAPEVLINRWIKNREKRAQQGDFGPDLRNDDEMSIPFCRYDFVSRFPYFNLPRLWNDLPHSLNIIKMYLNSKLILKSTY